MNRKAQAEIVVIVGVVLLAVAVIYYATQGGFTPSSVPQGVYQKQKLVHESFMGMARKGSEKVLGVMEMHGGYPTAELLGGGGYQIPPYTVFMDEGIPYWAMCEKDLSPSNKNITRWFELSMENYIRTHISEITSTYKNASFDLSKLSVSASISSSPHKIDITINLPTKVDGYSVQGNLFPYKFSISTKLGEISDFARDFSKAQSSKRFLEVFTEASIYFSKDAEDENPKLPTAGVLTNCGEVIFRTPQDVSNYLREIAEYVITQTLWWQDMPVDTSKPKVYAINREIIGKEYRDLEISMHLPDNFAFDTAEPIIITNDEPVYTSPFWDAFKCMTLYGMTYSVSYPVIVRVKDPLSGESFNFAVMAFVDGNDKKMAPGKCEDIGQGNATAKQLNCSANLTVVDESGKPIYGAVAAFGKVVIGVSDSSGRIEGRIECGNRSLSIYKNSSYDFYARNVSSSKINGTYVLHRVAEFYAHFRQISITGTKETALTCLVENLTDISFVDLDSGTRKFTITNLDPKSADPDCMDSSACRECKGCNDEDCLDSCGECASGCIGGVLEKVKVDYAPSGRYDFDAIILDTGKLKEMGGFISKYEIKANTTQLYFNIPLENSLLWLIGDNYKISDERKGELAENLEDVCGMNPVSEKPYQNAIMTSNCTCVNLRSILDRFVGSCLRQEEISGLFCKCPTGTPYPSGCSQPCSPGPCTSQVCPPNPPPLCYDCCASPSQMANLLGSKCNMKVIFSCG